jgi:putative heme transporter
MADPVPRGGGVDLPRRRPPVEPSFPRWLVHGAGLAWRFLVMAAALFVLGQVLDALRPVVLPVIGALFLTAILSVPTGWLRRHRCPPLLATWAVCLISLLVLVGLGLWLVPTIADQFRQLGASIIAGIDNVKGWLTRGPLHLSQEQLDRLVTQARSQIGLSVSQIAPRVVTGGVLALQTLAEVLLTFVLTFFFLKDGEAIAQWLLGVVGEDRAPDLQVVGQRSWELVGGYIRGTAINGVVNGILMAIGLLIIGVPLVAPIAVLTFAGGFFPLVGAILSGAIAALVALVAKGPLAALVVVGLTTLIHHVEGYLVGPLVLGRAVRMHPVAILLALSTGTVLGGVIGAALAVPALAVILAIISHYGHREDQPPAASQLVGQSG